MSERDFSAGGREFKLNKIDPFKQFHIVRRLGPILGDIIPVAKSIKGALAKEGMTDDDQFDVIAKIAQPVMNGLSKLTDEDATKVLCGLLSSVEVKQAPAGNWAFIARGDTMAMNDIEFPILLQAAGRALAYNLSGFFSIAPQISHGGK